MDNNNAAFYDQELPFSDHTPMEDLYSEDQDNDDPSKADYFEACCHCSDIKDFLDLTDAMVDEINELRAEVVRWRQVLIKYLSPEWADGLRQDILDNLWHHYYEDFDAFNYYVEYYCNGKNPMDNRKRTKLIQRLIEGTDETSITYL